MYDHSGRPSDRRFIPADESAGFPVADLAAGKTLTDDLRHTLMTHKKAVAAQLTQELRRLLNHNSMAVSLRDWLPDHPVGPALWLSAFTSREAPAVLLGLDERSLFYLSELFFGGEPDKLSDKHLHQRQVTDTERRLVGRVFNTLLATLCPPLNLALDDWQSAWVDSPSFSSALWTIIEVSTADWTLQLHCGWPASLTGAAHRDQEPVQDLSPLLRENLKTVPVQLTVEVARMALTLADLAELDEGDILPLDMKNIVTASAGSNACLAGQLCEHGEGLALRITDRIGD